MAARLEFAARLLESATQSTERVGEGEVEDTHGWEVLGMKLTV